MYERSYCTWALAGTSNARHITECTAVPEPFPTHAHSSSLVTLFVLYKQPYKLL